MKLPCAVTRDLLPLYTEKMLESETTELVQAHLADCPGCRQKLSELNADTPPQPKPPDRSRHLKRSSRHAAGLQPPSQPFAYSLLFTPFSTRRTARSLCPGQRG